METKDRKPIKFPTSDYLIYWDRQRKAAIVATGRFRGQVWTSDHDSFFDRKWSYVGILDGRRIKRINYVSSKDFLKSMKKGLRKVYFSTIKDVPREFRNVLH